MATWLYQMSTNNEEPWNPEKYRLAVWEGQTITWGIGRMREKQADIHPGDSVIFFFCPNGPKKTEDFGIYGWGIITRYDKRRKKITFRSAPPSDYLKISVCIDDDVYDLVREIRKGDDGKGVEQLTMYRVSLDQLKRIRLKICDHMNSTALKKTAKKSGLV